MRLTVLCVSGILLAFLSLSWTTADSDEGDLLGDNGFGPCAAVLRPEGPCRQGQDESMCPYLFNLPPLTVHLPKQLRELEKIVEDLQKLKDNVDQLRKMCADCTVSQTERECGRQREREHEKLNEGTDSYKDERNWLNERNTGGLTDINQECGIDGVKAGKTMETYSDTNSEKGTILEEKGRKKWEAEGERDEGTIKENGKDKNIKQVAEKDGKTQTEGAKGKDELGQAKVPTAGGYERKVNAGHKKGTEKNNRGRETERNKGKDGKGDSKGEREDVLKYVENEKERKTTSNVKNKEKTEESDHHVWRDETKETKKKIQTVEDSGSDGIKMSEDHDKHTNKEKEPRGEERKKEMEKGIKVERNNEKPKQTESIGRTEKERTIKEGEEVEEVEEEEERETGKEIKTEGEKNVQSVQRDSDRELSSNKAIEGTDFVSISPTPRSTISSASRHDAMDSNEAITVTSSLPPPPLSTSAAHLITDASQRMKITADRLTTQSAGLGAADKSERPGSAAEAGPQVDRQPTTVSTLGGIGQKVTSVTSRFTSTMSSKSGAVLHGQISSTTATASTTTPHQNLHTTTFPGVADRSRWTAKKNISSNTKTGVKPLPDRGPRPGEKHKPAIKPEAEQKPKNPKNDRKSDRVPLPDKKPKHDQKQKPSQQKPPTDQKSKPGKDPKRAQIPKPDQRPLPDNLPTEPKLKGVHTPEREPTTTTHQNLLPTQRPQSQKPAVPAETNQPNTHEKSQTVNTAGSDKDGFTDQNPKSVEIPDISQNPKPEKKPGHSDQKQKPDKKLKDEEKTKLDQTSISNEHLTPVQEPEHETSETTTPMPKHDQKPVTELLENYGESPSSEPKSDQNSSHGQKLNPERVLIKVPDQKPKPSQTTPKINQKPKPSQTTPKINQKPKPGQTSNLPADPKLKGVQTPKQEQTTTTHQNLLPTQRPQSHEKPAVPAETNQPNTHQKSQTVNTAGSDKDGLIDQKPKSIEIPVINQNPKPEKKKPVHPLKTDKPDQKQKPDKKLRDEEKTKPDQTSISNKHLTPVQEPEYERSETTTPMPKHDQKPETEILENYGENPSSEPKSDQDSPGQKLNPDHVLIKVPDQKPKPSQTTPKINQKPKPSQTTPKINQKLKPGQTPKLKPKHTGQNTKPTAKSKPDQTPQTNKRLKTPQTEQTPNLKPKSVPDIIPAAKSNNTSKPRPPPKHRPTIRPKIRPGATPAQRPKPAAQPKPSPKTKTDSDPSHISRTAPDNIQKSQTDMPPASGPIKQNADVTHSPGDTEFSPSKMNSITPGPKTSNIPETGPFPRLHGLPEGFTMSSNSRITSDLRPQTAGQPPSIPMTTRPNKVMQGILPGVISGSAKPKQASNTTPRSQAKTLHNVEETSSRQTPELDKMVIPAPSPSTRSTPTTSRDLSPTTAAPSGPEPLPAEASTPSARELRVKINQVAAFFNNTLSPNGKPLDAGPKEHPEGNQGGSWPDRTDTGLPTPAPPKVAMVMRDCSDLLLRGETKSGVYLVTPDLRSRSFHVFCDMELDGGGWTVLQRRQDGSVSFNRSWTEYRLGFGELDGGEFWLGNNMIHLLTRDRDTMLRVELEDFDGVMEYAEYKHFRVASERMRYRLTVDGYSGTAGDALRFSKSYDHNNRAFTTPDRDHDRYPSGNCGAYYSSGWWFDACMAANLNGRYYVGKYKGVRDGIFWGTWHNISTEYYPTNDRQSFKSVRMMIRPKGFTP